MNKNMKNENAKHTPGPWSVNDIYPHQVGAYPQDKPGRFVCETINHSAGNCCHTEEDRSNARLIAAAPELLAAVCDFEDAMQEVSNRMDATSRTRMAQVSMLARAAIAKAKGE